MIKKQSVVSQRSPTPTNENETDDIHLPMRKCYVNIDGLPKKRIIQQQKKSTRFISDPHRQQQRQRDLLLAGDRLATNGRVLLWRHFHSSRRGLVTRHFSIVSTRLSFVWPKRNKKTLQSEIMGLIFRDLSYIHSGPFFQICNTKELETTRMTSLRWR